MYSPRIPERLIPILYRLGRERGRPMTQLVAEAVERYLEHEGCLDAQPLDGTPAEVVEFQAGERDAA
jgi:hypothetical protein